ncbi:NXPE family member 3-like [Antedon mediterranea]|uniref:NXPE family member 3-like n=1 Tax=Antedon mediterranea TaxID=105859 RepID=UPI003AF41E86
MLSKPNDINDLFLDYSIEDLDTMRLRRFLCAVFLTLVFLIVGKLMYNDTNEENNTTQFKWLAYHEQLRQVIHSTDVRILNSKSSTDFTSLDRNTLTSAKHTRVQLITGQDQIVTGNYVDFLVTTFDRQNKSRNVGGDFWFATLHDRQHLYSTSGRITDLNNGSYLIRFYLGCVGDMVMDLTLVYTAEALYWIRQVYRPDEYTFLWWGIYKTDDKEIEKQECRVKRGRLFESKCEYGRGRKGMGDTVFVCDKPLRHRCDELKSIESDENTNAISKPVDRLLNKFNFTEYFKSPFYNEKVPLLINLNVQKSIPNERTTPLPRTPCRIGFRPQLSSNGYWEYGKWKSLECKTKTWSTSDINAALTGHEVHIIGDSTVKQWYVSLNTRLGRRNLGDISRMHFKQIYSNFAIQFHYNRLPVSLGKRVPIKHVMEQFEPELIDGLPGHSNCKYLIILGHWAHYGAWTEPTYRDHMFYIKEAIVRLMNRCSDVKVAIRSSHPRDHKIFQTRVQSNHWVFWDMNRIIRELYAGVRVHFIDVWDLALSYPSAHDVHMPTECVNEMVDLLMSHVFYKMV